MGVSNLQQGVRSMGDNSDNLKNKIVNLQAKIEKGYAKTISMFLI